MRKLFIGILLASVAVTPALAASGSGQDRKSNSTETQPRTHTGRSTPPTKSQPHRGQGSQASKSKTLPPANARTTGPGKRGATPQASRTEKPVHVKTVTKPSAGAPAKVVERSAKGRKPPTARPTPTVLPKRPPVSRVPRPRTEPPLKTQARPTPTPRWNTDWRNDHRYDWHNWRSHHHSRYHLHTYIDPFGWGYYRYWIGWRLWPRYYASSYWISDPWYYRLPPAPPGTRWIRYYNDALLVDMWTGEVIDVIHDFFW